MDDLMTFDEPSGGHTSARSSETVTRRDIIGELTDKFDQLLEVCQSNLLEIQKLKAGAATVDSVFKPTVNSTPVQQRENGCGNVNDGCSASMQSGAGKFWPAFDISKLGQCIEMYEMLFEVNGVTNHVARYQLLATAMLKGNCSGLFSEFRESCTKEQRTYINLKEFLTRRGRPLCKAENLLTQMDKNSTRTMEDSLRLAQSIRSYDADTHAKIFLYNEVCKNEPAQSSLREYFKRLMNKPFKEFEDACMMMKAQCQYTSRVRQSGLDERKSYPPRTFVRTFENNSNSPRAKLCYFHFKFGGEAFNCEGGTCTMINHPTVKFVQGKQPFDNRRESNQGNAKLS